MNTWKQNLEETKQHYIDWWQHKGTIVNMWEHFQQGVIPHADIPQPETPRDNQQRWFDPEWRARFLDWYVAHSCLKADILPVANTHLGPGSLAAILGGRFEGGDDTIWIHPDPDFKDDITFDPQRPNYLLHKELLKACKQRAQGHYYVGMPDLMEGLDVLAALKGTDQVLMDTVMQPEVVERQMQQINDIYFHVFDELYEIIREGDEMAFCYFSSWAPGKMTKLQSDISTMISEDDYRRFVQPFIRQQCHQIPYTLYHLDGVGAIRHLTALLEIDELNAIQWTPGAGEPQGGSPKWFDLYRRIIDGGKSVLCSWVTLDELPALLDAVGTDGVHLEMDFHNEQEVEQALEIVEKAQQSSHPSPPTSHFQPPTSKKVSPSFGGGQGEAPLHPSSSFSPSFGGGQGEAPLSSLSPSFGGGQGEASQGEAFLVLDGAMGTMIQQYHLNEQDFRGQRFKDHPVDLKGCNDLLTLTRPDIIDAIHRRYLNAGADIIETCTFNAQRISLADYGLQDCVRDINLAACRIAREAANACADTKPRLVAGSIGPTNKTITPTSDKIPPLDREELATAYREQIEALIDGGVDALLIETIFDVENARVCIDAAHRVMAEKRHALPVMLSFSVNTPDGHNLLGQDIVQFIHSCMPPIYSVGVNCHGHVAEIAPLIRRLATETPYRISLYPNAGHPDSNGRYAKTPEALQADLWPLIEGHWLNIVGGCCGTTDAHIAKIAQTVQPFPGLFVTPHQPGTPVSVESPSPNTPPASEDSPTPDTSPASEESSTPDTPLASEDSAASLKSFILLGRADDAVEAVKKALDEGADPQTLIDEQMIAAMTELGQLFEEGKAFVPQLLMAGRAMKAAMKVIHNSQLPIHNSQLPIHNSQFTIHNSSSRSDNSTFNIQNSTFKIDNSSSRSDNSTFKIQNSTFGKVLIGTVKGDLHDIGKNLVAAMLEGCGFEVVNIGIDVSAERFIEEVKKHQPDILALSALLTTTMPYMREVISQLEQAGIRDRVKIIVGGAPVSQRFADEIGADGYSDNANSAVALVKQLLKR